MKRSKHGLAVIFNHEKFVSQPKRTGTNLDRDALKSAFKKLLFDIEVYEDLSQADVLHVIKDCKYTSLFSPSFR